MFLADQVLERILILILELLRIEMPRLGLDDMPGKLEHVFRHLLIGNIVEIVLLVADLVWVTQRETDEAFAARLERHHVLA